mmetsp:Transcript_32212/g.96158  ORF Transcript_32212/g.96158 Transcript_32212/m.96158 type:complete len:483 (-) Transcript_32212:245-1693(-)
MAAQAGAHACGDDRPGSRRQQLHAIRGHGKASPLLKLLLLLLVLLLVVVALALAGAAQPSHAADGPTSGEGPDTHAFVRACRRLLPRRRGVPDPEKEPWGVHARPNMVGHRGGGCDKFPEHSVAAYLLGIAHGTDVSECDVCWSSDLVPICRHEPYLSPTTNAMDVFPDMVRTKLLDGESITDVWAEDLTAAQLQQLRLHQKTTPPYRTHQFDGAMQIVTFEEHVQLVQAHPRNIAIIPELKHSTYFNSLPMFRDANTTTMQELMRILQRYGYDLTSPYNSPSWRKRPVFIQSFEQNDLVYFTSVTCVPAVQLVDGPGSVTVDRGTPHDEYIANASLDRIGSYATFYGPWKDDLAVQPADDALALPVSSGLCQRAQQRGLIVTPYTFRPEADQMAPVFHGIYFDEFRFFIRDIGVDGIWTDSASSVTEFYDAEELAGHQWSAGTLARLNQVQTSCKRPSSLDVEIAKQQYPQLDFSIHTPKG